MVFANATANKFKSISPSNIIQYILKEKSWQFDWNFLTTQNCYRIIMALCGHGGTGRRVRLRGVWETVWVQVSLAAPKDKQKCLSFFVIVRLCCAEHNAPMVQNSHSVYRDAMLLYASILALLLRTQVPYKYTPARTHKDKQKCLSFFVKIKWKFVLSKSNL